VAGRERYLDWTVAQLVAGHAPAAVVVAGCQQFQIRPRTMRRNVAAAQSALARSCEVDIATMRGQVFMRYEAIYCAAMAETPPHTRVALTALDGEVRLLGLAEPDRIEIAGVDPNGVLTSRAAIVRRLRELEGRAVEVEAEIEAAPVTVPSDPDAAAPIN
jgi:hypothetical protein